jgi:hypothetical protein
MCVDSLSRAALDSQTFKMDVDKLHSDLECSFNSFRGDDIKMTLKDNTT